MVHHSLVGEEKLLNGEAVTVRCARGDTTLYPLAEVDMELEGVQIRVKAAVADWLPVSVLLGTDVPELGRLLRTNPNIVQTEGVEEALRVMTRAVARREELEEVQRVTKEESGVILKERARETSVQQRM